MRFRLKT